MLSTSTIRRGVLAPAIGVAARGVSACGTDEQGSGSGESTLMRMFYGVEQPDRGAILLDGEPVVIRPPRGAIARGVGMVFQRFGLVPGLAAVQNIVLVLMMPYVATASA